MSKVEEADFFICQVTDCDTNLLETVRGGIEAKNPEEVEVFSALVLLVQGLMSCLVANAMILVPANRWFPQ